MEKTVRELSLIERRVLSSMSYGRDYSFEQLLGETKLNPDSVRRASGWLLQKKLLNGKESKETRIVPTEKGKIAYEQGLPERRMLDVLKKKQSLTMDSLKSEAGLENEEFNAALGLNKKKAFISILKREGVIVELSEVGKEFMGQKLGSEKTLAEIVETGKCSNAGELIKRGLAEEQEIIERTVSLNEQGKKAQKLMEKVRERAFVLDDKVEEIFIGKKQPYVQFLNIIRRKLTELGFKEMNSPLIVQEFYNFDVLFQPQNHPARTWSDTYQLLRPKMGKLPHKKVVKAVKDAHEHGGISASSGWRYSWVEEIAQKMMPAAHGTAHSARQLVEGVESPGKYFTIARCFRPDVMDATHLIEFNQLEGFIVGEELNFRHLLGTLKEFAVEIAGAEEIKFYPDYYPFTEPSVQLSAKHPKLGWIELGGAGMFRPEMLENLGIKGQAIAWGIGIDRLAMFKLGVKDIRRLFSDDLQWLRDQRMVVE